MKLLVILFILKLYARRNIFKLIYGKYGPNMLKIVRSYETVRKKIEKIKCDINFLLKCKKNNIFPTFVKPKFAITVNKKIKCKIHKLLLETKITNQHYKKKKLTNQLKETSKAIEEKINYVTRISMINKINETIKNKIKIWKNVHQRKFEKLALQQMPKLSSLDQQKNNIIHNYSSHQLSNEEKIALSHSLDEHIPSKINGNMIKTEFESFYSNIIKNTQHLTLVEKDQVKSKLRRTCENYTNTKNTYKHHKTIENLSKNSNIALLKQDKGRGVVILDNNTYIEKCYEILDKEQFKKLEKDPTKTIEGKVQRSLRKIKEKLNKNEYKQLYPSGSSPGLFYGTAKIHKLKKEEGINDLNLRPIISNIGTATYELAKYLSKILEPLGKNNFTIKNSFDLINRLKEETIPEGYVMVSFDVKGLFTNVPLDRTLDIIMKRIYNEHRILTEINQKDLKNLLILCTKHVHFSI